MSSINPSRYVVITLFILLFTYNTACLKFQDMIHFYVAKESIGRQHLYPDET